MTTKHIAIIAALGLLGSISANAQNKTYKLSFGGADKKVQITSASNQLRIEGYTGTEVIIELEQDEKNHIPKEADGLRLVTANGVDNTGIGATANVEGSTLKIVLAKSKSVGNYKIKIPKETALNITEAGNASNRQWLITGFSGEVDIKTSYNDVMIKDVSGPIVAKSGYGKISVVYDKVMPNKPNSIYGHGPVDVTLPADTKANLALKSSWAEVFTDFDLVPEKFEEKTAKSTKKTMIVSNDGTKTEIEHDASEPAMVIGQNVNVATAIKVDAVTQVLPIPSASNSSAPRSDRAAKASNRANATSAGGSSWNNDCDCPEDSTNRYTINGGGGVKISLRSDYGNVYLRKKK